MQLGVLEEKFYHRNVEELPQAKNGVERLGQGQ